MAEATNPGTKRIGDGQGVAPIVERNIKALLEHRRRAEENLNWNERLALTIARFTGSTPFLLLHVVVIGAWVGINRGSFLHVHRFDPSLIGLSCTVSVESIFLATFILMTQRHMMAQADRRADLNLQVSLLAEHEITRLLTLTKQLAQSVGVEEANEPDLKDLEKDTGPDDLLARMEEHEKRFHDGA